MVAAGAASDRTPPPGTRFQRWPSHTARFSTATPPAVPNVPPAYTRPWASTASARTTAAGPPSPAINPPPRPPQLVPSHRATFHAGTPPAVENAPPTKTEPSVPRASASTGPFTPSTPGVPGCRNACHADPFQRAMFWAGTLPTCVNVPPSQTPPESSAISAEYTREPSNPTGNEPGSQPAPSPRPAPNATNAACARTPPKRLAPCRRTPLNIEVMQQSAAASPSWSCRSPPIKRRNPPRRDTMRREPGRSIP